jgi:hypothetical protein
LIVVAMTMTTAPTEAPSPAEAIPAPPTPVPALDVVVPVCDEEAGLESCLRRPAANRRLTFGVTGRAGAGRHQLQGPMVFALGLGLTSGSLALLHSTSAAPPLGVEVGVLVGANLAATVLRFLLLRI